MALAAKIPPAVCVTPGAGHYFFGYYDKPQWNRTERLLAALRVDFMDRPPGPDDTAEVGIIDPSDGFRWHPVAKTSAWNWQQGCMLQWLDAFGDETLIFNDRRDGRFVSVILEVSTGRQRILPMPIYAVSPRGDSAISVNFARIHRLRPGYGYVGAADPWQDDPAPDEDGLYRLDLATGRWELIVTYRQVAQLDPWPDMTRSVHWFNHIQFSRTGERFCFLHRWRPPGTTAWKTRIISCDPHGGNLYLLPGSRKGLVSHYDWRDDRRILVWMHTDALGEGFHVLVDLTQCAELVGRECMTSDGHCSFSPDSDRRWILCDTYPRPTDHCRLLYLFDTAEGLRLDLGAFHSPPQLTGEIRCDLHPRWGRTTRTVTFDSAHEGRRGIYMLDVSQVTGVSA